MGVIGSTGNTSIELIRSLVRHPAARLRFAVSESHAGENLAAVIPAAPEITLIALQEVRFDEIDGGLGRSAQCLAALGRDG